MSINNSNAQNKLTNCTGETFSRVDFELFKSNALNQYKKLL